MILEITAGLVFLVVFWGVIAAIALFSAVGSWIGARWWRGDYE